MARYVMSDIHGEAERFHAMLEKIRFSADDTLIFLEMIFIYRVNALKFKKICTEQDLCGILTKGKVILGNHYRMF